jgi:SAM-dependent methyltransferase
MIDLWKLATSLTEVEPGLWTSTGDSRVSYPVDAHKALAEIEDTSFWFRHRAAVLGTVLSRFPPNGPVFDVGGGNGYMVRELRARGIEAILVEPGEDGARAALARGLEPVVNATLTTAGFRSETLLAVALFDVLEHIEDDVAFLEHIAELLQPHGLIYITVPAHMWLWSGEDERSGHFRRYTAASLRNVCELAQFDVEFDSYFFSMLPLPILTNRTIPSILRLRKEGGVRADEHRRPSGRMGEFFDRALARELDRLDRRRIRFGSSLVVVARRKGHYKPADPV